MSHSQVSSLAAHVHAKYSSQIGSEQIVQLAGLNLIGNLIVNNQYKSFLEIGSGIGTIADFILQLCKNEKIFYTCYEVDSWCQDKLKKNLENFEFNLIDTEQKLSQFSSSADLIIVDDFISYEATYLLIKNSSPKMIFVEGHRRAQRLSIIKCCRELGLKVHFTNYKKTKDSYKLGCTFQFSQKKDNLIYAFAFVIMSLMYSKILELRSKISIRSIFRISG